MCSAAVTGESAERFLRQFVESYAAFVARVLTGLLTDRRGSGKRGEQRIRSTARVIELHQRRIPVSLVVSVVGACETP